MNGPLVSPAQVRLLIDDTIRDQVRGLDDLAHERFIRAWEYAQGALDFSLRPWNAQIRSLISFDGVDLVVGFCRDREVFLIVSFEDSGEEPEPPTPPMASQSASLITTVLNAVSADATLSLARDDDANQPLSRELAATDSPRSNLVGSAAAMESRELLARLQRPAKIASRKDALDKFAPSEFRALAPKVAAPSALLSKPSASDEKELTGRRGSSALAVP